MENSQNATNALRESHEIRRGERRRSARHHFFAIASVIAAAVLVSANYSSARGAEEMTQLETLQKSIEYRQSHFPSGRVLFLEHHDSRLGSQASEFLYTAAFNDDKFKVSRKCRLAGKTKWSGSDTFVLANDTYLENFESHPNLIVRVARGEPVLKHDDRRFAFDPRAIGMVFGGSSAMGRHGVGAFAKFFGDDQAAPVAAELDGVKVMKLERSLPDGRVIRLFLDPARGYGIVAATYGSEKLLIAMRTTFQESDAGWFPETCTLETRFDGRITSSQTLAVQEVDWAASVSEQEFTVARLQLLPGRVVVDDSGYAQHWNGTELVPYVATE